MGEPKPDQKSYTLDDWKDWEGRWELIDGVAYNMAPAPSTTHQRINTRLLASIFNVMEAQKHKGGSGDCEVFVAPLDVFLGQNVFQPDLVVVCDPSKVSERGIEGAPDLVVEILSPSTAGKDLTLKRWHYEAAGVPEYLWIDPEQKVAVLLRLQNGKFMEYLRVDWGETLQLLGGRIEVRIGE